MRYNFQLPVKILVIPLISLLFLLISASSVKATTYIVAKDGSGNYTLIQDAADVAQAGDTVLIKEGVYSESIQLSKYSGNQNAYITYKAFSTNPNKRPIIDGSSSSGNLIQIGKSFLEFNGLEIRNSGARGIAISGGATNVRIINSLVHDSQISGIVIQSGTNHIIQNVKSYGNGIAGDPNGGHGLILYQGGNNSQILDSEFYNNGKVAGDSWASGIELFGDVTGVLIQNNRTYGNTMHGIDVCGNSHHNTVTQNISYRNSRIGIGIDGDAHNNRVDRNIVYENGPQSGWGGGIHLWRGAVNNEIYNNVVYKNLGGEADGGEIRFISGAGLPSINNIVKNNVTFPDPNKNLHDIKIARTDNVLEEDYNNFASNQISYLGQTYNLAGYKNISGHSQHSVATNPLFIDQANYNFRLQNTSPNIDAGVDVGLPFVGSAPDIGAFEYSGVAQSPSPASSSSPSTSPNASTSPSPSPLSSPSPSVSPSPPSCFNSASPIDSGDVKSWAVSYLTSLFDTNSDSLTNSFEFGYLVSHWGQACY